MKWRELNNGISSEKKKERESEKEQVCLFTDILPMLPSLTNDTTPKTTSRRGGKHKTERRKQKGGIVEVKKWINTPFKWRMVSHHKNVQL